MIFAREVSDNLTSLVKAIDNATIKNKKMGSFVVFCNDSEKLEGQLKELAKKEKLEKCVLSLVDSKSGPGGYDLHKDADITVVLYVKRKTVAEFAYKKGEFKEKDIKAIVDSLPKILD
ncbi:MAG: hypothetical protein EBV06_10215 [Planctomycetia bacterium]|nr:hypothetical protein [Planctomycetia bacterium]